MRKADIVRKTVNTVFKGKKLIIRVTDVIERRNLHKITAHRSHESNLRDLDSEAAYSVGASIRIGVLVSLISIVGNRARYCLTSLKHRGELMISSRYREGIDVFTNDIEIDTGKINTDYGS